MEKEQEEVKVLTTSKFTWTINNFYSPQCWCKNFYSETFFVGPYSWQIAMIPSVTDIILRGLLVDRLYAVDIVGWRSLNFKLSLVNQLQGKSTIIKVMKSTALFLDFMGLCKIEKDYVQLLEKSYSKYPSLIESHIKRNRSQRFNELSFTTLGKLLHFLKTKKVKDMKRYDACKELQDLWDEAEIRFDDLSWLEPHVKSALSYFKNASKVERLKANVVDLEEKAKTLKAEAIAIDAVLETTKKELAKAEEGFVARDLDDQLGYGIIP
ncbi:uncharacterized protein LOC107627970 isoform X3 [Arachis ipaensis]|uniref:uncharacterized protein LOC107627970 isoform X3 n=1 Tax=Arachis ipaensis TaxID=130454 RepID=UPI000A2B3667|nr:uncharacterized protein LOC107627970 isoform X3 [Arachis ipaensis]